MSDRLASELDRATKALQKATANVEVLRTQRADVVRKLHESGWAWAKIAERLGVTRQRVQAIAKGEG